MVAPTGIRDDLDTVQAHIRVWRLWSPYLLASLDPKHGIMGRNDSISNGHLSLASYFGDDAWEVVFFGMLGTIPGYEETTFSIVAVICEPKLRPNEQDLAIETYEAAVVAIVSVNNRNTDIQQDAMKRIVIEKPGYHLPGMQIGVGLEKMVKQAIASDLELRPNAKSGALRFGNMDRLFDAGQVALPVEHPLIKRAGRNRDQAAHVLRIPFGPSSWWLAVVERRKWLAGVKRRGCMPVT